MGFGIELPHEQRMNDYIDLGLVFDHFYARKTMFVKAAEGFCVFPGGFGTADELFESLTLIQTGKVLHFPCWSGRTEAPLLSGCAAARRRQGWSPSDLAPSPRTGGRPARRSGPCSTPSRTGDGTVSRTATQGRRAVAFAQWAARSALGGWLARQADDPLAVERRVPIDRAREESDGTDQGDLAARVRSADAAAAPAARANARGVVVHESRPRAAGRWAVERVADAARGYSNLGTT